MKRWPAIVLIVAAVVGAVVHDSRVGADAGSGSVERRAAPTTVSSEVRLLMPRATPASAAASTWYCVGGPATAEPAGGGADPAQPPADHRVVVANPTSQPITGVLTAFPSDGGPVTRELVVEARSRLTVAVADVVDAPYAAALVELAGGGAVVEHELRSALGSATAPCASDASSTWFFAAGSTRTGATETLVFFNPFPGDAVLDVAFSTDEGRRSPKAFQDLTIPGRTVRAVTVTDKVTVREVVAAAVDVRVGRLVVDRVQTWDDGGPGAAGTTDPATTPATPTTAPTSTGTSPAGTSPATAPTPEGPASPAPTDPSSPTTTPAPTDPSAPGTTGVAPIGPDEGTGEVAPEQRFEEPLDRGGEPVPDQLDQDPAATPVTRTGVALSLGLPQPAPVWFFPDGRRIAGASEQYVVFNPTARPAELELSLGLSDARFGIVDPIGLRVAAGGVEVVDVDGDVRIPPGAAYSVTLRSVDEVAVVAERVSGGTVYGATGVAIEGGSPLMARRWLFAGSEPGAAATTEVVVLNPGDQAATVVVEPVTGPTLPSSTAPGMEVPAGGRVAVRLDADAVAVVVTGDRPVVAQRGRYRSDGGFATSMGVPVDGTASRPDPDG